MCTRAGAHAVRIGAGLLVLNLIMLGAMSGVPQNFLGVLTAPSRDLVGVLQARHDALTNE